MLTTTTLSVCEHENRGVIIVVRRQVVRTENGRSAPVSEIAKARLSACVRLGLGTRPAVVAYASLARSWMRLAMSRVRRWLR